MNNKQVGRNVTECAHSNTFSLPHVFKCWKEFFKVSNMCPMNRIRKVKAINSIAAENI